MLEAALSKEQVEEAMKAAEDIVGIDDAAPGQLAIAAAHPANLADSNGVTPFSMRLPKMALIEMWENGAINAASYIRLLLKYELDARAVSAAEQGKALSPIKFDETRIEKLIHDWRGMADPMTGKCKELTVKQILTAIAAFSEKDEVTVSNLVFYLEP